METLYTLADFLFGLSLAQCGEASINDFQQLLEIVRKDTDINLDKVRSEYCCFCLLYSAVIRYAIDIAILVVITFDKRECDPGITIRHQNVGPIIGYRGISDLVHIQTYTQIVNTICKVVIRTIRINIPNI